jgi:hypothetical protein
VSKAEIDAALYGSRSKFNVDTSAKGKEARTYDGIPFHSVHERDVYANYVKPQVNCGYLRNLRFQVPFDLHVTTPGGFIVKVGTYKADFVATGPDDKPVIIEAKGKPTELYKRTKKHFEAEYGLQIQEM